MADPGEPFTQDERDNLTTVVADTRHWARFGCGVSHPGRVEDCIQCNQAPDEFPDPETDRKLAQLHQKLKATQPSILIDRQAPNRVRYEIMHMPNEQADRIIEFILPSVIQLYLTKSQDYGGNVMELMNLGPKACIPDLLRKFGKLKRAIWDEQPMTHEQPKEILMDLVGHILIILDEMERTCSQ